MSFLEYVSSKLITLCFLGIGGIVFGMAGALADAGASLLLFLAACYLLTIFSWLFISFWNEKRKLKKLELFIAKLPEKYLLAETLPTPADPLQQRYFQIMKEISRSAVGKTQELLHRQEEYCDYVENWIHEIKTPLTACSLILEGSRDIKKLQTELKKADNLTETILYYVRMRTLEKATKIQRFSMADVIEEAVKSQMELLIASKIRVEANGDFTAYSDPKAICFLLKQLLINCAKYCPGCLVKITAAKGAFSVEDNGIGIPSHELRRVTDRGFTGTNGKKFGNSTGMGLYIVRGLCESLDIDMQIDAKPDEYTKLTFTFRNRTLTKM